MIVKHPAWARPSQTPQSSRREWFHTTSNLHVRVYKNDWRRGRSRCELYEGFQLIETASTMKRLFVKYVTRTLLR